MHRCLVISELIAMICGFSNDADNARMALVCRAFRDPALDTLWSELWDGIMPLVLCFPRGPHGVIQETTEVDEDGETCITLSPRRPPLPEEWTRVLANAQRVRLFTMPGDLGGKIQANPACYRLFIDHWPDEGRVVFPRLRNLTYNQDLTRKLGLECSDLERMFVRRITRLCPLERFEFGTDVAVDDPRDTGTDVIPAAVRYSSESLRNVAISLYGLESDFHEDRGAAFVNVNEVVRRLHALRTAYIAAPLTSDTLSHLAQLRNLTTLDISFFGSFIVRPGDTFDQALRSGDRNFPALTRLRIALVHDSELDLVNTFLGNISHEHLKALSVRFDWVPSIASLDVLVQTIGRARSLTTLMLQCNYGDYEDAFEPMESEASRWPIPFDVFSPILRLSLLQDFRILDLPFVLTPSDIEAIARAWPNIRKLVLNEDDDLVSTSVRIRDLKPLVDRCAHLKGICVPLCHDSIGSTGSGLGDLDGWPKATWIEDVCVGPPSFVADDDEHDQLTAMFPAADLLVRTPSDVM